MKDEPTKVLLIEDDFMYASMMEDMLVTAKSGSFTVEHVPDLTSGLECMDSGEIDIVLLDLMLPDSTGFNTFARTYTSASHIPIIVLSGIDDEAVAIKAVREGAQDYLVKAKVDRDLLIRAMFYAITRKDVEETLRQRNRELALLNRVGRAFSSILDPDQVLISVLEEVRHLLDTSACSIWLTDPASGELECQHATGPRSEVVRGWRLAPGQGLAGWVVEHCQGLIVADAWADKRHFSAINKHTGLTPRSILTVPLQVKDKVIGVLQVLDTEPNRFDSHDMRLLEPLAASGAIAIENAQLYKQVRSERIQLQALSRRLVEVQESERRHIARELHDEIGQTLTGLNLVLDMATRLPETTDECLREAQTLVNELLQQVRDLSLDLRPSMLDDLGLLPALVWHFERYTSQTNVQVNFEHRGIEERRFASEVETAVYRIVQEALTNVARHAEVDVVRVRVEVNGNHLTARIEDQGTGFSPNDALVAGGSSGLAGMRERAVLLGGQLGIESTPHTGTCLTAQLPLKSSTDPV